MIHQQVSALAAACISELFSGHATKRDESLERFHTYHGQGDISLVESRQHFGELITAFSYTMGSHCDIGLVPASIDEIKKDVADGYTTGVAPEVVFIIKYNPKKKRFEFSFRPHRLDKINCTDWTPAFAKLFKRMFTIIAAQVATKNREVCEREVLAN